jgi:leucyl-tRNA synthetase
MPEHIIPHCSTPQAVSEYSADAMRWALADAGDGMDDANFETSTANAAILRLTKELAWAEEMLAPGAGTGPLRMHPHAQAHSHPTSPSRSILVMPVRLRPA